MVDVISMRIRSGSISDGRTLEKLYSESSNAHNDGKRDGDRNCFILTDVSCLTLERMLQLYWY